MILKDLITETNAILEHNPGIDVHENNVIRILNRHYEQISSQHSWLFLNTKAQKTLYATVSGSATATVSISGTKTVTGVGTAFHDGMAGQLFVADDGVEHRISAVKSTTVLYLVDNYSGTISGSTDWSVTFDRVSLPRDCVDYLGITDRTNERRFVSVDARAEEDIFLDRTASGDAHVAVENLAKWDQPQDVIPTMGLSAGSGFTADEVLEYVFVREVEGREGVASQVHEVTPTGSNLRVSITNLTAPDVFKWNIYRRNQTRKTGWYYVASIGPDVTGSYTDAGDAYDYTRPLQDVGPTMYLRVSDLPSEDITVEVRYMRRPNRLTGIEQAPEWPPQYHQILVWKAASELLLTAGQAQIAMIYENRADAMVDQMRKRYLGRKDRIHRFAPMTSDSGFAPYQYGTPTKT